MIVWRYSDNVSMEKVWEKMVKMVDVLILLGEWGWTHPGKVVLTGVVVGVFSGLFLGCTPFKRGW